MNNVQRGACRQAERKMRSSTLIPEVGNANVGTICEQCEWAEGVPVRIVRFCIVEKNLRSLGGLYVRKLSGTGKGGSSADS